MIPLSVHLPTTYLVYCPRQVAYNPQILETLLSRSVHSIALRISGDGTVRLL